jgi:sodium/proline symporter
MLSGAVTVVVWANLTGGWFDLYEIVPGFIVGSIVILGVTKASPQTKRDVLAQFDESMRLVERA